MNYVIYAVIAIVLAFVVLTLVSLWKRDLQESFKKIVIVSFAAGVVVDVLYLMLHGFLIA
ncbi:hypothetical protein ACOC6V_002755 [Listeria monocytogenes]|uniref:Uncharacterized protein n=4 Tax=Listeria TaxID=1637 RepID=D7V1F1_LISGR|nr:MULTISPECIES: hypothetical protein [Listeria]EAG6272409.1 hypothetical protein [Listeria monocytogenes CFSAN003726]EAG6284942.1 hypothetical protein [Listeria monocytogenes CFSAN003810]EAG6360531.1 hypothetical protein [Listeria monocytogenes CFSAN003729]EAG6369481.1 hypothetical protein [Listeria monocytogenes CFSAN003728]ECR3486983.1 hypothetical protein [Listeria innocua]MCX62529.1 hypothetical protein [Listeria monocytogenes serotype 4b]MCX98328.1 hypothetical protein [Listeria monocy